MTTPTPAISAGIRAEPVAGVVAAGGTLALAEHANLLGGALTDLSTLTVAQTVALFRNFQDRPDFPDVVKTVLPQIVAPHARAAAAVTAQWYNELAPTSAFRATPVVDLPAARIDNTIGWALHAPGQATPLERIAGSAKRMVFDASRDTVVANAQREGVRWVRQARPDACPFCRLMATRGPVYHSETSATEVVGARGRPRGAQALGDKYHDHCRCIAAPVRAGGSYIPPAYTAQWQQDYIDATRALRKDGKQPDLSNVLAHMRANSDAH